MNKPLDMADKYDSTIHTMDTLPASFMPVGKSGLPDLSAVWEDVDDEPTIRMQVPSFPDQVVVESNDKRYPGIGLLICLGSGLAFWGTVAYLLMH